MKKWEENYRKVLKMFKEDYNFSEEEFLRIESLSGEEYKKALEDLPEELGCEIIHLEVAYSAFLREKRGELSED